MSILYHTWSKKSSILQQKSHKNTPSTIRKDGVFISLKRAESAQNTVNDAIFCGNLFANIADFGL